MSNLPFEIVTCIFEHVPDQTYAALLFPSTNRKLSPLPPLCLVCPLWRDAGRRLLYRQIPLETRRRVILLLRTFRETPALGELVYHLFVDFSEMGPPGRSEVQKDAEAARVMDLVEQCSNLESMAIWFGRVDFLEILLAAPNLRRLNLKQVYFTCTKLHPMAISSRLESLYLNMDGEQTHGCGSSASLPLLRNLTCRSRNSDYLDTIFRDLTLLESLDLELGAITPDSTTLFKACKLLIHLGVSMQACEHDADASPPVTSILSIFTEGTITSLGLGGYGSVDATDVLRLFRTNGPALSNLRQLAVSPRISERWSHVAFQAGEMPDPMEHDRVQKEKVMAEIVEACRNSESVPSDLEIRRY